MSHDITGSPVHDNTLKWDNTVCYAMGYLNRYPVVLYPQYNCKCFRGPVGDRAQAKKANEYKPFGYIGSFGS